MEEGNENGLYYHKMLNQPGKKREEGGATLPLRRGSERRRVDHDRQELNQGAGRRKKEGRGGPYERASCAIQTRARRETGQTGHD